MLSSLAAMPLLGAWYDPIPVWMRPVWMVALGAGAAVGALLLAYFLLKLVAPKVAAIARTTSKEAWAQPLFWVEVVFGTVLLVLFMFLPYNTFGDDIKVVKDSGLTLIMVLAIVQAVWTASVTIAEELEGRTALTLLSKPISRRQFVLGKFLGVLAPVFSMFIILGTVFLSTLLYKTAYDARETSHPEPTQAESQFEIVRILPGFALAFFEAVILASISVAISTRLPMLPNLVICTAVYVLGHLTPLLVQSSWGQLPLVTFIGRFIATIFPVLDYFNVQGPIATGRQVPLEYVGVAFAYCAIYSTIAMLLALVMFEDRDLA